MSDGILIVQSGGPTAVSNVSLAAAADEAFSLIPADAPLLGARFGVQGMLKNAYIDLRNITHWDNVKSAPGAALGSSRYRARDDEIEGMLDGLEESGIRYILMMGGNGTMGAAGKLTEAAAARGSDLLVGALPDTVDNDIRGTDFCSGFAGCARYCALAALDIAADVRSLPTPVSIIEVMGRNTGWIAASSILGRESCDDGPHRVYLPEVPVTREGFLCDVQDTFDRLGWVLVTVAEGVLDLDGERLSAPAANPAVGGFGGPMVGDVGSVLAHLVTAELGLRARCEKPGLSARAAAHVVSSAEREFAEKAARFAVNELYRGNGGFMAAFDRMPGSPLRVACRAVPFSVLEPGERPIPQEFLSKSDGQPNHRFAEYAAPLIGALHHHHTLLGEKLWTQHPST